MPILSPVGAEILIALVAIMWGIIVETWFVSRWTIFFNIIPVIALLAVFDTNASIVWFMSIFLIISIVAVGITRRQWIKHLVGAKGFGTISLVFGLIESGFLPLSQFWSAMVMIGAFVYFVWGIVYLVKKQYR